MKAYLNETIAGLMLGYNQLIRCEYEHHNRLLNVGKILGYEWGTYADLSIGYDDTVLSTDRDIDKHGYDGRLAGLDLLRRIKNGLDYKIEWFSRSGYPEDHKLILLRALTCIYIHDIQKDSRDTFRLASIDISRTLFLADEYQDFSFMVLGLIARSRLRRALRNEPGMDRDLTQAAELIHKHNLTNLETYYFIEKSWQILEPECVERAHLNAPSQYRFELNALMKAISCKKEEA